jgi:hypothetical protein
MDKKNLYKEDDDDDVNEEEEEEEEEEEYVEEEEEEEEEVIEAIDDSNILDIEKMNNHVNEMNYNNNNNNTNILPEDLKMKTTLKRNIDHNDLNTYNTTNIDKNLAGASQNKNVESEIKDKLDLLDLDLESMPKDELINMLLKGDEEVIKKDDKKKKHNFQPRNKSNTGMNTNDVFKNMQHMSETKDPELAQDFNVALTKILAKMVKDSGNPNQEIFDILISDRDKVEEELQKVYIIYV